jgi:hypothetical protein
MNKGSSSKKFYKYYDAETAIKQVLAEGTRKWSSPFDFNDPFDNQYEFMLDKINDEDVEKLLEAITEPILLLDPTSRLYLKDDILEGIRNGSAYFHNELKQQFLQEMAKTCIFCLTESNDNLLMWSHYAQQHSGLVIEFSAKDSNSVLHKAEPVHYSTKLPKIKLEDFFNPNNNKNYRDRIIDSHIETYTRTKSIEWSYEKESRIVVAEGGGIRPYFKGEVDAVYLGCKITIGNRRKIIRILRQDYPLAKLYQASKSKNCFSLIFDELLI